MRKSEGQKTPEKEIANFKFTKPFERGEILSQRAFSIYTDIRNMQAEVFQLIIMTFCKRAVKKQKNEPDLSLC